MEKTIRKKNKEPFGRRKKLAEKILENNGKSISGAMREVGYSEGYSKNPQLFKKTKKWKELMEKFLPESKLAKLHAEQLEATDKFDFPDNNARLKALDLGYKIKDLYPSDKIDLNVQRPFANLSDDELADYIKERKKFLLKK